MTRLNNSVTGADKNNATEGTGKETRKIAFPKFGRVSLAMKSIGGSDATVDTVGKCRAEI